MKEILVAVQVPDTFIPAEKDCEGFCPFSNYDGDDGELTCPYDKEICPLVTKKL